VEGRSDIRKKCRKDNGKRVERQKNHTGMWGVAWGEKASRRICTKNMQGKTGPKPNDQKGIGVNMRMELNLGRRKKNL